MNSSVELLETFLKAKASIGAKNNNGRTATHHACEQGHMALVEVRTKNTKVDLMAQAKSLHTLMSRAIHADHQHIVIILLPKITFRAPKVQFLLIRGHGQ